MALITPATSSHWYTQTGDAAYGATLREARKQNLLPSITTILKIINNEGLEVWKQEQVLMAALTLPREPMESEADWIKRVVQDSRETGKAAAASGTAAHDVAEKILLGKMNIGYENLPKPDRDYARAFASYIDEYVHRAIMVESIVTNLNEGYAGRIDALVETKEGYRCLVDFKTQNSSSGKRRKYDSWIWQLGAQSECIKYQHPDMWCNVIAHNDGKYDIEYYEKDDIKWGYNIFRMALELFREIKGFGYVREINV